MDWSWTSFASRLHRLILLQLGLGRQAGDIRKTEDIARATISHSRETVTGRQVHTPDVRVDALAGGITDNGAAVLVARALHQHRGGYRCRSYSQADSQRKSLARCNELHSSLFWLLI